MTLKPLNKKIAIEGAAPKEKTEAGIFIPASAQEVPTTGKVIAVGPAVESVKIDDQILYGKHTAMGIRLGNQHVFLIDETDVLAKIE